MYVCMYVCMHVFSRSVRMRASSYTYTQVLVLCAERIIVRRTVDLARHLCVCACKILWRVGAHAYICMYINTFVHLI